MEGALCLDAAFPRCLLRQRATSINDLPQEILEQIIIHTVKDRYIQVSLASKHSRSAHASFQRTREFAIPFLVSRKFYNAASATLLSNLRLSAANLEDPGPWLDRLALCPEGAIRWLEIRYAITSS